MMDLMEGEDLPEQEDHQESLTSDLNGVMTNNKEIVTDSSIEKSDETNEKNITGDGETFPVMDHEENKSPRASTKEDASCKKLVGSSGHCDLDSNCLENTNSNDHPLNLSESLQHSTTSDQRTYSDEVEDDSSMTASRCRVYNGTSKDANRYRRGLGETSLTICGINNLLVPYKCRQDCGFASVSLSALKIHSLLKHSDEDFYMCTLCCERFVCGDSLLEHICKKHYDHNKIVFSCNIKDCLRSFKRVENLKQHLIVEHKDHMAIPCSFCFRDFHSAENAINHIKEHLKQTLRCAYCLVIFQSREEIVEHIKSSHVGFLKKINLHVEIMSHERKSKEQDSIKNGSPRDSLLKPNSLPTLRCEEAFIISPPKKPLSYQCQDCSFTCNDELLLNAHIKEGHLEHADITKDFSCNFCKFSTNNKDIMVTHLSFHTNATFLRCYSCPYCSKQSNSLDIMEGHLHSQHPSELFKFEAGQESIEYLQDMVSCPLCNSMFKWKSSFCSHVSRDHNLERLADYLMFQCNSDASRNSLVLTKQFLVDELEVILPDSFYAISKDINAKIKNTKAEEFAFKCIKCDFKNSNYNIYNEHVKKHYKVFNMENKQKGAMAIKKENPMMFVCKLCPFQCNKSLNFKRHSAIHERAKSLENCFKCGYCMFKHDRINCIKFHLGKYHERLPIKVIKITNGEEIDVTESEIASNLEKEEVSSTPKKESNKPSNEYFDSFLPRGMIFPQPIKCPNCDYANRVRVNLMRHMRQHFHEDSVPMPKNKSNPSKEGIISEKSKSSESLSKYDSHLMMPASGEIIASGDSLQLHADGVTTKKLFKCAYCDVVSKWNRRDISLHILHVHLQKKVYTCSYCDYGSRKSSQMVMNHCSRVHPGKPVIIKDELALFNSVMPLRDGDGVIPVAFVKKNGTPILTLSELGIYLKLSVRKNKNDMNLQGSSDKEDKEMQMTYENKINTEEAFGPDIDDEDYNSKNVDNSEEWKCMFCGLQMFSEVMMKRHVMCHHMKLKPYGCKYCNANYWQKQSIENHIRSNHPGEGVCYVENVKEKISLLNKYMQKITNVHRIRQTPCKKYSSIYHCRICGYQDPRHDKAKYHVVKKHLKIGLYSCSKCHQYMGGKGCVENHIQEFHPKSDAYVCRSYDIHALFLQKNIRKISNFHINKNSVQRHPGRKNTLRIKMEIEGDNKSTSSKTLLTCKYCSYVAESEASLGAHARVHKVFACFYCDYQNNLVSRVQSHCLIRHPTKPIKHRQIAPLTSKDFVDENVNQRNNLHFLELDNTTSEVSTSDFPDSLSPSEPPERCLTSRPGLEYLYKCKLCNYNSEKATVIRHHIMSHLLYHPYQCPYCNLVCSVKSSPITKHIQLKHPDKEIRFICKRDEQMEKQVKNSFEKISLDPQGNITNIEGASQASSMMKDEQHFAANQKVYYKCCFCSLVTPIRTDMKHHLMRELKYKPFSCAYCQYEEPCRSKMGKHFRIKHPGMTISIKHAVSPKKELQIFEYLQKCLVKNFSKKSEKSLTVEKSGNIPIIRISNLQNCLISSLHYRGKFHKCSCCHFKTTNIKAFILHKSIHDKFKLKCSYCQYSNSNIFFLRRHRKKCWMKNGLMSLKPKKNKSIWLKSLKQNVSNFIATVKPVLRSKYSERWTCHYCSLRFISLLLLKEHLKKSHSCISKPRNEFSSITTREESNGVLGSSLLTYCCNECYLKFASLEDFSLHLQTHYTKKATFPVLEIRQNDDTRRFHQCGFCSFQTSKEDEFRDHVSSHTALHPIKCKHCLFASFTSSDMKQHFEAQHPNQDVRFDSLTQPYTMVYQNDVALPNFKPVVKLVDLKFCLS